MSSNKWIAQLRLSQERMEEFLLYMEKVRGNCDLDVIYNVMDERTFWLFLQVFESASIKMPSAQSINAAIRRSDIYNTYKRCNGELSLFEFKRLQRHYGMSKKQIEREYLRAVKIMEEELE